MGAASVNRLDSVGETTPVADEAQFVWPTENGELSRPIFLVSTLDWI
jgi:hypothetical protein